MEEPYELAENLKKSLGIDSNDACISFLGKIFLNSTEAVLIVNSPKKNADQIEISYANPAFLKLTGFDLDEIFEKNPYEVLNPHNKERKPVALTLSAVEKEKSDLIFHKRNGEPFLAQLQAYSLTNVSAQYNLQVQTYKELTYEVLLMESQQKYKSLFDNHPDGVFALGPDGKFTSVNQTSEQLTGFSKNELLTLSLKSLFPDEEKEKLQKALEKALQGHTNSISASFDDKTGKRKTLCITTIPIHINDHITGIYGILQDISETEIQSQILNLEKEILENIVGGKELEPTLDLFLKEIERLHPSLMLTIMLMNSKGTHLDFFVGSSIPTSLSSKLKEVPIEEGAGACGTAGFFQKPTIIPNVQQHPYMKDYFELAKEHHINACWSYPIFSSKSKLLGTFAIYKHSEGFPSQDIERIMRRAGNIISILIENKQNEYSYKQLNERFKLAIDVSNEAIWDWDIKNNTLHWGSGFELIFGYPLQEIEVTLEWWSFNLHPDDRDRVMESLENAVKSKYSYWTCEYKYKAADGDYRYVLDRGNIIRDKNLKATRMVGAMIDLTEQKSIEETIKESEAQFRSLADSTFEGIVLVSGEEILDCNRAFSAMVGLEDRRNEIIGRSILEFLTDKHKEEFKERLILGRSDFYEGAEIKKKRRSFPVEIRAVKSTYKGKSATTISIRDISERIKTEKELLNYASELARSNAELEQFAYMASHDLQEPLRMVTSFLQLLKGKYEGKFDESANQYIAFAMDGAERMKTLIKDLLKYSRISFQEEEQEVIDLNELLKELRDVFSDKLDKEDAVLKVEALPVVMGQKTLFSQLFQNIIGNGLKYRRQVPPEITVKAEDRADHWEFIIADNGIGIDESFHEKIFVIFQRLHSRDEFSGTGIGLAICKKIVEKYGGTIWVSSRQGEGSEFHFTLPKYEVVDIETEM